MARLNRTNSPRLFQALSIAAMLLAIAPTAQAAPKMAQRLAMQNQPLCFVQLPGKTTNLDKLCGLGGKGGNTINLDVDINRDGVSDQLLEATLQTQKITDAEMKRFQANVKPDFDPAKDPVYRAYLAATKEANLQLQARLPFSNQVKQALAAQQRISDEISSKYEDRILNATDRKEMELLEAKMRKIIQPIEQDPTLLKVQAAQGKVYAEIARRQAVK